MKEKYEYIVEHSFLGKAYTLKGNWQNHYFRDAIKNYEGNDFFEALLFFEGTMEKRRVLPRYLYRFCKPTNYNLLDIFNGYLHLSSVEDFNDLFDSKIAIDTERIVKKKLLKAVNGKIPQEIYIAISDSKLNIDSDRNLYFQKGFRNVLHDLEWNSPTIYNIFKSQLQEIEIEVAEKVKDFQNSYARVACFCSGTDEEVLNNTSMWGYYADNAKGLCIKYDINKIIDYEEESDIQFKEYLRRLNCFLFPIRYTKKQPVVNLYANKKNNKEIAFMRATTTKSTAWSKEKEIRLILPNDCPLLRNNKIKFPFIDTVFIGPKMESELKKSIILLLEQLKIRYVELTTSNFKYEMQYTYETYKNLIYSKEIINND